MSKIGVLLVHGIGQQTPYVHLHTECRSILAAMSDQVQSVGVISAPPLSPPADKWSPTETLVAETMSEDGTVSTFCFHEAFWADLGEPPTAMRQLAFWFWGLSMWATAGKLWSTLAGFQEMYIPQQKFAKLKVWHRFVLALHGGIFGLASLSVGILNFALTRFGIEQVKLSDLLTSYLGDIMLYTDARRASLRGANGGSAPPPIELQDMLQPPRAEIRKRMVRCLVAMASAGYDRWYILAHSQGSVVAFNGLMDTEAALAACLTKQEWSALMRANSPLCSLNGPPVEDVTLPRRPAWLPLAARIDRRRLFKGLCGFVTYGSPLEKYLGMWQAIVPCNRDARVFDDNFKWINVYNPTDPVSGDLRAFKLVPKLDAKGRVIVDEQGQFEREVDETKWRGLCYLSETIPYDSSKAWLLSHLDYLKYQRYSGRDRCPVGATRAVEHTDWPRSFLVDRMATWLLDPDPDKRFPTNEIVMSAGQHFWQKILCWAQVAALALVLLIATTAVLYWPAQRGLGTIGLDITPLTQGAASWQFLIWSGGFLVATGLLYGLLCWKGSKWTAHATSMPLVVSVLSIVSVSVYCGITQQYACCDLPRIIRFSNIACWSSWWDSSFWSLAIGVLVFTANVVMGLGVLRYAAQWSLGTDTATPKRPAPTLKPD